MGEPSNKNLVTVAQMGTWIVFDEIQSTLETQVRVNYLLQMMKTMRQLNRILLSHDAGAYQPGKTDGGQIRPYSDLFSSLILLLLSEGFTREELDQVMVKSPAEAFAVRVRKSK
jgi:phosphotriesterase-related protein